jgi:hypothetical protein
MKRFLELLVILCCSLGASATSYTCGYTAAPASNSQFNLDVIGNFCTTPDTVTTVTDCKMWITDSNESLTLSCGVYSNVGNQWTSTLICSGTINYGPTSSSGWVTIPLSGCPTLSPNTQYVVASVYTGAISSYSGYTGYNSTLGAVVVVGSVGFLPSSLLGGTPSSGYQYSLYLDLQSPGATCPE